MKNEHLSMFYETMQPLCIFPKERETTKKKLKKLPEIIELEKRINKGCLEANLHNELERIDELLRMNPKDQTALRECVWIYITRFFSVDGFLLAYYVANKFIDTMSHGTDFCEFVTEQEKALKEFSSDTLDEIKKRNEIGLMAFNDISLKVEKGLLEKVNTITSNIDKGKETNLDFESYLQCDSGTKTKVVEFIIKTLRLSKEINVTIATLTIALQKKKYLPYINNQSDYHKALKAKFGKVGVRNRFSELMGVCGTEKNSKYNKMIDSYIIP